MKSRTAATIIVLLLLPFLAVGDEKKPLTFRLTLMGEIENTAATEAGFRTSYARTTHLGFNEYEASNGEIVVIQNGHFRNADEAKRFFDWSLDKRAAQIVKREDNPDRARKIAGRRAEYLAKSTGETKKTWVVMWTDGDSFHLITAATLECALALERK